MKFAKWTFLIAGIYGLLILIPQYFLETKNGIDYPPAINHPEYYYGFIGVAVAWQIVFLIISQNPAKFKLIILAAIVEKFSYGIAVIILFSQTRIVVPVLVVGLIDTMLGLLFIMSYFKVRKNEI
ncbi:MAG TPA: hypothetical protein VF270_12385 [Ignavibacteriaceae bacterium]